MTSYTTRKDSPRPPRPAALIAMGLILLAIVAVLLLSSTADAKPASKELRGTYVGLRVALIKEKVKVGDRLPVTASAKRHRRHIAIYRKRRAAHRAAQFGSALASWYGPGFYGNTTACGQTYSTSIVGVAHKTLPCGTRITVCYRGCATGTVIDRGPYSGDRVFDLSAAMAQAVGFGGVDTVRYRIG